MNETQARVLREAANSYTKFVYSKPKSQLAELYQTELAAVGQSVLYGGPTTKDDLAAALIELRYPRAKMNESIHVLYHRNGITNDACEGCNPDPCPKCGALYGCKYSNEHGAIVNGRHVR